MRTRSIALAVCLACGGAAAQEAAELRVYDLRPLLLAERWQGPPVDWRSMLDCLPLEEIELGGLPVPLEPRAIGEGALQSYVLEGFLIDALGESWTMAESCDLDTDSGLMRVVAPAAVQALAADVLVGLETRALRQVELEAWVLPRAALTAAPRSVLAPAEVDALLAAHAPARTARARVPLGHAAALEAGAWRALLYDYDVEVATFAEVADPEVSVAREGLRLGAVVNDLAGGGYLLRAWGRNAELLEVREVRPDPDSPMILELPRATCARWAGSARVVDGGGLLLGVSEDASGACLVRVRVTPPAPDARWVPLGELTAAPLVVEPPWTLGPQISGGWPGPAEADPLYLLDSPGTVHDADAIVIAAQGLGLEARELGALPLLGQAWVVGGAEAAARLREGVRVIGAARTRNVEVEVRYGTLTDASGLAADALAERLDGRLRGACCVGDTLTLVGGEEAMYLKDFDVEIAQASSIADPIVDACFEGVTAWCQPALTSSGALACIVELEYQRLLGPWTPREVVFGPEPQSRDYGEPEKLRPQRRGAIEETATTRADVSLVVQPEPGAWALVASHSLPSTPETFFAVARFALEAERR
ncbi:MAG: hypothetical protein H6828_10330 [Planctomycetes bacterium]|nr:hypothetical protein [Planctomycetota bacterium]